MSRFSYILMRLSNSLRVHGIWGTLFRICRYPFLQLRSARLRRNIYSPKDAAGVFTKIYESNWWGSNESVSGTGSTLRYTANLRAQLPSLFEKFEVRTVLDAPCGDFYWMEHVVQSNEIIYIGGDIVPMLIERNTEKYAATDKSFVVLNVIEDPFPDADLWICRDCLIHFSFTDIFKTLTNFARSNIRYLLTTTHMNQIGFRNMDILTGEARLIDLFSEPFFLPPDYLYAIDDWLEPDVPRRMVLFERSQIVSALPRMRAVLGGQVASAVANDETAAQ